MVKEDSGHYQLRRTYLWRRHKLPTCFIPIVYCLIWSRTALRPSQEFQSRHWTPERWYFHRASCHWITVNQRAWNLYLLLIFVRPEKLILISESSVLPSKKRYNICDIPDPDGTCSGGTNKKIVPSLSDQTIEKRAINRPLPLDNSPQESELHDHDTPIKTSDTCSEHSIQESLIADLPLTYIPPEYPGYFPDPYKEIPSINFR